MTEHEYYNTSTNMVQAVRNIIDGYGMGPMRALAQEPVQNAKDAYRPGHTVYVEYRLLRRQTRDGKPCYLLTVTDRGTTGLRGPILTPQDLHDRNYKLRCDENWAAFEGQGYTKENEDALGSRGQGKAAFLYHSLVPGEARRMLMLYDTLLENGEYRLGVRFARPVDQVRRPLFDDEARIAIREEQHEVFDGHCVPLGLEPLRETGTRVIIPHFDPEVLSLLRKGGELGKWLQRSWWRAIQKGKLVITVCDEERDTREEIQVPTWWCDLPRGKGGLQRKGEIQTLPDGVNVGIWGSLSLLEGHGIRRLALLYDERLSEDEIIKDHPEFAGIQLLRGDQWIETRGAREEYGDSIPPDKRAGFRGFVEFTSQTDAQLRESENSQHDGFDGRKLLFREIRNKLRERVREFSAAMGWERDSDDSQREISRRERQVHARFLQTFHPTAPAQTEARPG